MSKTLKKKKVRWSGRFCAVYGCNSNSTEVLKWKNSTCEEHMIPNSGCTCVQPYQLHRLPNGRSKESAAKLKQWLKHINRKDFKPSSSTRVCSLHFIDGKPTVDHPYPVINMGYENYEPLCPGRPAPKKRSKVRDALQVPKHQVASTSNIKLSSQNQDPLIKHQQHADDHNYSKNLNLPKLSKSTQTDTVPEITVHDMNDTVSKFYTGLSKVVLVEFINSLLMWVVSVPKFKIRTDNQILLFLIRIRLGLMFTDLGVRFHICRSTACEIFNAWLPLIASYMRKNLIFWLPRDTLFRVRPKCFEISHPKVTCIIDCTEIFVQRPKDLMQRAQTFSNYKNHNTYKALFCIAPNGFVTYVSKLFGGRASDSFISKNSGFLDNLLPGDEVLADRGFTINEILPPGVQLTVPAFTKQYKDRILPEEDVTKTRRIANVRIHVERAIRRLKCFKILNNVIPGSMKNVDDILVVCAGLCNLQPSLINEE